MKNCAIQNDFGKKPLTRGGNTVLMVEVPKMRFSVEVKYHEEHGVDFPEVLTLHSGFGSKLGPILANQIAC